MIHVRQHPNRHAAIVEIHATDDSWHGHYSFSTAGLSPAQLRAKHNAILAHHAAKSARHEGFNALDRAMKVAGQSFVMHGLAIVEQGTDVRLILRVTTPNGGVLNLDRVVAVVVNLPTDAEIRAIVRDAAVAWLNREQVGRNHVDNVKQVLGV